MSSCSKPRVASAHQVLRISQRNEPATLDPQLATLPDEFFIIRALSEGLFTPNPDGGLPHNAVAERLNISTDGLVYTFQLRADAKWSNGDPVTAADFVYSIRRALTPALAAPKAALFFPLKNAEAFYRGRMEDPARIGARAQGDHELELTLGQPCADFLAIVASGPWIPVHRATVEQAGATWTRPGNFVGNGPFTLTAWRPNQEIIVTRNPLCREAARIKLTAIRFLAFDNRDSEERAFRAAQVDVTMDAPAAKLAGYRAETPSPLHTVPLHETRYIALNTTRPPLDNPAVRRALALALDRRALVEKVLLGGQRPAFSFIPPGLGGYEPATQFTEDVAEARRLIAGAGFPEGRGFPKLELTTWSNSPMLEAVQQMWRRNLGIEIALAQHEARTHLATLAAGDYALALVPAIPDYDGASDLFEQLLGGNPSNYPHWSNAAFDRLVHQAGQLREPAARTAAYREAEKILLDDMPLIPLYFNAQNFLLSPRVQHWEADRLWTRFYRNVGLK